MHYVAEDSSKSFHILHARRSECMPPPPSKAKVRACAPPQPASLSLARSLALSLFLSVCVSLCLAVSLSLCLSLCLGAGGIDFASAMCVFVLTGEGQVHPAALDNSVLDNLIGRTQYKTLFKSLPQLRPPLLPSAHTPLVRSSLPAQPPPPEPGSPLRVRCDALAIQRREMGVEAAGGGEKEGR
eukprot:946706-Rhodomonas_salina.2